MSFLTKIAAAFISLETFVKNLFTSVQKEYLNLQPEAQALFTNLIKWGNLLKGFVTNPASVPGLGGFLITEAETLLGTTFVGLINSVLSEVLLDLGIIKDAITDPAQAWESLVAHLKTFSGTALGKELLKITGSIAETLSGLETNEVTMIFAFVYKTFFKSTVTVTSALPDANQSAAPVDPAVSATSSAQPTS